VSGQPVSGPIPDPLPRSGPFGIVPREIAEDRSLSGGAVRTYIGLACFANKARKAWPAVNTLAKIVDSNRRNVQRWLRELEMYGHIRRERFMRPSGGWGPNTYHLLRPDAVVDDASESVDAVADDARDAVADDARDAVVVTAQTYKETDKQTHQENSASEQRASPVDAEEEAYFRNLARRAAENRILATREDPETVLEETFEVNETEDVS
jgi:predicted transcriptional regulator